MYILFYVLSYCNEFKTSYICRQFPTYSLAEVLMDRGLPNDEKLTIIHDYCQKQSRQG